MPKVYFHDVAFRNILLNQFLPPEQRLDRDVLVENYAYTQLRDLCGNDQLHFWRTADAHEIDFILTQNPGKGEAIEIKFDEKGFNPSKYQKFIDAYPGCSLNYRAFKARENKIHCLHCRSIFIERLDDVSI